MESTVPASLHSIFWDVDPSGLRLPDHADYVMERIMTRGGWDAMRWLRRAFPIEVLRDFLMHKGQRLPPRERAYWDLVAGIQRPQSPGGGRPSWAGT